MMKRQAESTAEKATEEEFLTSEDLEALLQGSKASLDSVLAAVQVNIALKPTSSSAHIHCVRLDGNGRCLTKALARTVSRAITNYCIPRARISEARTKDREYNTTEYTDELRDEARGLFVEWELTGEPGEVLLSIIAQHLLKLPQLLCKMSLKTNRSNHYHGIDGIHGGVDSTTGKLHLYWGEAKLHKDLSGALDKALKGLQEFLSEADDIDTRQSRDIRLLTDNLDLNDDNLQRLVLAYLDRRNPKSSMLSYRAICLIGFDSDDYPKKPNELDTPALVSKVQSRVEEWCDMAQQKLSSLPPLDSFVVEVLLIPFESVQDFRDYFLACLGLK